MGIRVGPIGGHRFDAAIRKKQIYKKLTKPIAQNFRKIKINNKKLKYH